MESSSIGFIAASASVLAFGSQFVHILKNKTTAGISIYRSVLDIISLVLWIAYSARLEDIPLLIATSFELTTGVGLLIIVIYNRKKLAEIKSVTPSNSRTNTTEDSVVEVRARSHSI